MNGIERIKSALKSAAPRLRFKVWRGQMPRRFDLISRRYDGPKEHGYLAVRTDLGPGVPVEALMLGPTVREALESVACIAADERRRMTMEAEEALLDQQ